MLITTIGGVLGPIMVYFVLLKVFMVSGFFDEDLGFNDLSKGWAMVTNTDISLAWLCARGVFGDGHPAIDFLLLLAVVDDALGLLFITVFCMSCPSPRPRVGVSHLSDLLPAPLSHLSS